MDVVAELVGDQLSHLSHATDEPSDLSATACPDERLDAFALVYEVRPVGHRDLGRARPVENVDHDLMDHAYLRALHVLVQPLRDRQGVQVTDVR